MKSVEAAGAKSAKVVANAVRMHNLQNNLLPTRAEIARQNRMWLEVRERFDLDQSEARTFYLVKGKERTLVGLPEALRWIVGKYVPQTFKSDLLALIDRAS